MTARERVLKTFRFLQTDRAPYDLMEAIVWPELQKYFAEEMGLASADAVYDHFDLDFRWFWGKYVGPHKSQEDLPPHERLQFISTYSDHVVARPLRDAQTRADLDAYPWPDPNWWDASEIGPFREKHPDKAIVLLYHNLPPFMTACSAFGIEEALMRMAAEPLVFEGFMERYTDFCVACLEKMCPQASGYADICWFMDDIASQRALLMRPDHWRKYIKDSLRRQIEVAKKHGLLTLYHSCGSVREIIPDLIDIGLDALEPFQTTAEGMDAESIHRDFGGKLVFYGGMDVQQLLTFGREEDVRREVRKNVDRFADCGGYIVANAHHCLNTIQPRNIVAMLEEARSYRSPRRGNPRAAQTGRIGSTA